MGYEEKIDFKQLGKSLEKLVARRDYFLIDSSVILRRDYFLGKESLKKISLDSLKDMCSYFHSLVDFLSQEKVFCPEKILKEIRTDPGNRFRGIIQYYDNPLQGKGKKCLKKSEKKRRRILKKINGLFEDMNEESFLKEDPFITETISSDEYKEFWEDFQGIFNGSETDLVNLRSYGIDLAVLYSYLSRMFKVKGFQIGLVSNNSRLLKLAKKMSDLTVPSCRIKAAPYLYSNLFGDVSRYHRVLF